MPRKPTSWNRMVARLRGEIPAAALEAYRRASLPVHELFEQVDRRRLECRIDGLDPWTVPPATRAAFLCAWNAYVLQTLGSDILDADYHGEPATHGYVPPVTAEQVLSCFEQVEGWVNRAYQALANPDFALDVEVPASLPAWREVDPFPPAHLRGVLNAVRTVRDQADAAMAFFPEAAPGDADRRAQLHRVRQLHASTEARARYAEELCGVDPVPEVHGAAGEHAREAIEQLYLLGQLIADPSLARADPPALAAAARPRQIGPSAVPRPHAPAKPALRARPLDRDARVRQLLAVAADPRAPLRDRKIAIVHAGWGFAPVEELVALYERLDDRELRDRLLFGLVARPEDAAVETLARVARDDPEPSLRRTALYWLRNSRHPRAAALAEEIAPARPRG